MKVFLVMRSTGSYEDYMRCVDKVFAKEIDAKKYIHEQSIYWDEQVKLSNRCKNCPFFWEIDNVKNRVMFMEKALRRCPDAQFDWDHMTMPCNVDVWSDMVPSWEIDEREVGVGREDI